MKLKRLLRWTLVVSLLVIGIVFVGMLVIQGYISGLLQDYVQSELGWSLKIGSAQIQFHPLSVRLESIELSSKNEKPFFHAKSASANLPYSSFWNDEFLIHQVALDSPKFVVDSFEFRRASKGPTKKNKKTFRIEEAIIRNGEVEFKGKQLKEMYVKSQIDSQGLRIKQLNSSLNNIKLNAEGTLTNWTKPELNMTYDAEGDAASIVTLFPTIGYWKGPVVAKGSAKGQLLHPLISGNAKSLNMSFHDSSPFTFDAQYRYDFDNRLRPISFKADFASLSSEIIQKYFKQIPQFSSKGKGTFRYSGTTDIWEGVGDLSLFLESKKDEKLPLSGEIFADLRNGSLQINRSHLKLHSSSLITEGTLSQDRLHLNANFQSSRLRDIAFLSPKLGSIPGTYRIQANLSGPYDSINARGIINGQSGNSVITANGSTNLGTKMISLEFQGNADSETLNRLSPDLQKGNVQFQGSVHGTWKNPVLTASLSGSDVEFHKLKLQQISGQIETKGNRLQFHADAPDLQLQADGSYHLNTRVYEIKGKLNGCSAEVLSTLYSESIPVRGKVHADFEVTGNVQRWRDSKGTLRMQMPELTWKNNVFNISQAEVVLEKRIAQINASVGSQNAQLELNGTTTLEPRLPLDLQVRGNVDTALIENFSRDWKADGMVTVDATIRGSSSHPILEGELQTQNLNVNYLPNNSKILFEQAHVIFAEQKLDLQAKGDVNGSGFSWRGSIPLSNTSQGDLHFEVLNLPVSTFSQTAKIAGNLNITGDLQGKGIPLHQWKDQDELRKAIQEWSGKISISPTNLKLGQNNITLDQPILISIQDREIRITDTRIRSGDLLTFQGSGNLSLQTGRLDSSARLEAKIDLLSSLKADIQSSGPLTMDVRVSGTMENPEYQGTIQVTNASLRIPDSPLILENLDLSASLEKKRLRLDKLEARSGGGVITGGGELVRGVKGSQVWVRGKNVAANYPEGLRSQMDFELNLSASESDYLLSGDVRILRSLYEQELTFRNPIVRKLLATSKELTEEKQFKNRLKLALNIQTVQDLRFRNNSAILRVGGDLKIGGSLYKPRLTGGLSIREGSRIFLAGNQYDVEEASLEFYGSEFVEPNLDVTLSSLLRDFENDTYYEVFLPFGGTISNIEFKNVRATPSLSQDQVFSLITDGTIESEHIGSSSERFQRQILSFFAGQALGVPSAKIAKSIGLSRIKVQQEGLSSVNDPKTRLMLGKDIGSGFSLIYSFVLNDPQDQTWIATYRYGRNIIGRFIDQDDGTYTVSVSHRIPFGKGVRQSSISTESRKKERGLQITSIELKNGSPLTEKQIYKTLKMDVGDDYDYWDFQDRAEELKKELQKMEFLYPIVDVREKEVDKGAVSLEIQVQSGDRSRMIFQGYKIDEKMLNRYKKMWRSGISAVVVQQMIREDLLRQIQLNGYYRVSVDSWIEKTAAENIYYFQIDPREQFKSVEIQFRGSRNYDPKLLQKDLEELYRSPAELFREAIHKPSKFADKIKMLYAQEGYLRAVVEPDHVQYQSDTKKIVSVVQVTEGAISRIDSLTVSSGEAFPESLVAKLQLKEGEIFHSEALLDDELKIREFYESKGNQNVSLGYNIEFSAGNSDLVLQWKFNTGPVARIASIRIEGNESTRTDLIRKQINFKEGDVLTEQSKSVAKKRLSDLGIFQQTSLEIEETEKPGWYDVVDYVVENKKYEFQYGGRYNTDDKAGAEIRLTDFNFLGRAQNLSLYTRSTLDLPLFRVDYIMPITGSYWDRMRLSIFRDETDEDVRATISDDLVKIPFTHKQLTAQFQQDHRFWNSFRVLWGFEFGSVTADFQDLVNGNPLQFQGTKALFAGALLSDRRDDPLNAKEGYFYSVDGEFAPTVFGSDISYLKNFSQFFYYKKLGKIVSATGIRAGFLKLRSNILTVGEKFRTGGSTTLRGFEHNTVVPGNDPISIFFGGNSVFILNEEIRFPIYKWFTGAVFYDAGNTYFRVSDFDPTDLRHSAGFGFRAGGGGFVLRIDLGFNLDPEDDESQTVFHFGIGQAF